MANKQKKAAPAKKPTAKPKAKQKQAGGRPPAHPSGRQKKITIWLNPAEIAHMETVYESVYAGMRALVEKDMKRAEQVEKKLVAEGPTAEPIPADDETQLAPAEAPVTADPAPAEVPAVEVGATTPARTPPH